jgi:hypothetical protein
MLTRLWKHRQSREDSGLRRFGLSLIALIAFLTLSGCGSISVNETPTSPAPPPNSPISETPPTGPRHDLAIMGVDFSPELDVDRLANREPVTLIVGVMNKGNRPESGVVVKATLSNADGSERLLFTQRRVESITAGNVVAVRLTNNNTPPFLNRYRLTVEIVPVAEETNLQNNNRSLDIIVNSSH